MPFKPKSPVLFPFFVSGQPKEPQPAALNDQPLVDPLMVFFARKADLNSAPDFPPRPDGNSGKNLVNLFQESIRTTNASELCPSNAVRDSF